MGEEGGKQLTGEDMDQRDQVGNLGSQPDLICDSNRTLRNRIRTKCNETDNSKLLGRN